jgi:hypothetical protein
VDKGECILLITLRIILAIIVIILVGYGLITGSSAVSAYMMLFMGAMLLVMGISEMKMDRKRIGFMSIIVSLFVLLRFNERFLIKLKPARVKDPVDLQLLFNNGPSSEKEKWEPEYL